MRWQKIRGIVCSDFPSTWYLKRLYSLMVKSFVSFFVRGLRCSWEGLALLDSILPALLVELERQISPKASRGPLWVCWQTNKPPTFNDTNVYKADKLVAVKTYKNQQFCLVHLLNVLVKALHHFPDHCKRDFIFNDCSPAAIEHIVLCPCCLSYRLELVLDLSLQMLSCSHYYNGYTLH